MGGPLERVADMVETWWRLAHLTSDVQSVVAMRLLGFGGVWSVPADESTAMLHEKGPAFTEAMLAGTLTAISGRSPDQVMQAAITPLCDKARENRQRLAERGPRLFGLPVDRQG